MLSFTHLGWGTNPAMYNPPPPPPPSGQSAPVQVMVDASKTVMYQPGPPPDTSGGGGAATPGAWYQSPWTYVGGGLALAGVVGVVLALKKGR